MGPGSARRVSAARPVRSNNRRISDVWNHVT
jgi:hypothetical protein